MRPLLLFAALTGFLAARADTPANSGTGPGSDLPGYELRSLDRPKRVLFQVGAAQVEVAVPVFVYWPVGGEPPAARPLHEAQAALQRLSAKPEWTAEELRQVIAGLEQAARLLQPPAPPGHPVPTGKE
jgi:hypothetical protein